MPSAGATVGSSPGSVEVSADAGNPAFAATLELLPPAAPAIAGSAFSPASPPGALASRSYLTASYPALASGTRYDLHIVITQYTNLASVCQKHFDEDLGTIVTDEASPTFAPSAPAMASTPRLPTSTPTPLPTCPSNPTAAPTGAATSTLPPCVSEPAQQPSDKFTNLPSASPAPETPQPARTGPPTAVPMPIPT